MAINFVNKSEAPKEKKPKSVIARRILFILAIVALVALFFFMFAKLSPFFYMTPLLIFWLFVFLVPSVCTVGIVWASAGYRNFVLGLMDTIMNAINSAEKVAEILRTALPYIGSISLALVIAYTTFVFIIYKKAPEGEGNKKNLLIGLGMFGLAVVFFVVDIVITFAH